MAYLLFWNMDKNSCLHLIFFAIYPNFYPNLHELTKILDQMVMLLLKHHLLLIYEHYYDILFAFDLRMNRMQLILTCMYLIVYMLANQMIENRVLNNFVYQEVSTVF